MALTRSFLKGMGITDEQVSAIIEAHSETVTALKDERDSFKETASKADALQKELDALKVSGGDWQKKYEKEHSDFEAYKADQTVEANKRAIKDAYKDLLKNAGVSEKRIDTVLKVADLSALELDENGVLKDSESLTESIKSEWSDFITVSRTEGAETKTPPENNTPRKYTLDDVSKMSREEINANWGEIQKSLN